MDRVAREIPVSGSAPANGHHPTIPAGTQPGKDVTVQQPGEVRSAHQPSYTSIEQPDPPETMDVSEPAAQEAMTAAMNHMVDSLVGPDDSPSPTNDDGIDVSMPTEPSMITTSAGDEPSYDAPGLLTAAQLVKMVQNYSSSSSSQTRQAASPALSSNRRIPTTAHAQSSSVLIPSIWNTPFAPQPQDLSLSLSQSRGASSRSSPRTRPGSGIAKAVVPPIGTSSTTAGESGTLGSFHSSSIVPDPSWSHRQYPLPYATASASPTAVGGITTTGTGMGMMSPSQMGGSSYYPTPTMHTHRRQGSSSLQQEIMPGNDSVYAGDSAYDALMATEELWGGWAGGSAGGGMTSGNGMGTVTKPTTNTTQNGSTMGMAGRNGVTSTRNSMRWGLGLGMEGTPPGGQRG